MRTVASETMNKQQKSPKLKNTSPTHETSILNMQIGDAALSNVSQKLENARKEVIMGITNPKANQEF